MPNHPGLSAVLRRIPRFFAGYLRSSQALPVLDRIPRLFTAPPVTRRTPPYPHPSQAPLVLRRSLLLVLTMLCLPAIHQAQTRYSRQYLSVAGKKMAYETFGLANRRPGDPILIFEAGFAASGSMNFTHLFPALSKFAAGIAYDRNGDGDSEEDTTLSTDASLVQRLHALLEALRIPPPYILVGHSMGAAYIRLFTALYPKEVAGLIFIDGADFMLTKQQDEEIKQMSHGDKGGNDWAIHAMDSMANDTLQGPRVRHRSRRLASLFRTGIFGEYDSLAPLPDIPVGVLIAYNKRLDSSRLTAVDLARIHVAQQFGILNYAAMIANNHHSEMILLPGYTHMIHKQDPDRVVSVITHVYQNALKNGPPVNK
jgi:pimeloyl-ACP methyl ester carboxylesterase